MSRRAWVGVFCVLLWTMPLAAQRAGQGDPRLTDPTTDPGADFQNAPGDVKSPGVKQLKGNWPWGEMFYGKEYPTSLEIKNECRSSTTVGIFVNNLPYLAAPATVSVPGKSTRTVPLTIKTPPPPNPIVLPGGPKIDPNLYTEVQGNIVLWHPWRGKCLPKRIQYDASGHIHFEPPKPPPTDPDARLPEKIAGADPCQVWWNTGQRPPQVKNDSDCVDRIRQLASEYRGRVLQSYADRDPAAWGWLPPVEAISGMSIGDLFQMKARADAQARDQR